MSWGTSGNFSDRLNIDDFEVEEEVRPDFPCPYCYEDFDIASLCSHLEEEHSSESRVTVSSFPLSKLCSCILYIYIYVIFKILSFSFFTCCCVDWRMHPASSSSTANKFYCRLFYVGKFCDFYFIIRNRPIGIRSLKNIWFLEIHWDDLCKSVGWNLFCK